MKRSAFSIAFLLLGLAAVDGWVFPAECTDSPGPWPRVCCPFYESTRCGAAAGRGECRQLVASRAEPQPDNLEDERSGFPGRLFNWTCQCSERFMGANCGECAPGWTGPTCSQKRVNYRRSILSYSTAELERFHAMLHYCHTKIDTVWSILVTIDRTRTFAWKFRRVSFLAICVFAHYYATKPYLTNGREVYITNYAHDSTGFLTYHRHWILLCERQLQRCMGDDTVTIPYYPWETSQDCLVCNDAYIAKNGIDGGLSPFSVYSSWGMSCANDYPQTVCLMDECTCSAPKIVRMAGYSTLQIPQAAAIYRCLNLTSVDTAPWDRTSANSFRRCLELAHNTFHAYCGGVMAAVPESANDPMFMLHHCNVDRIIEIYIQNNKHTPADYPPCDVYGHTPRSCVTPAYNCFKHKDLYQSSSYYGIQYI